MVHLLFVATHNTPGVTNFIKSLDKFGYNYQRLGFGEIFGGWRWRMELYLRVMSRLCDDMFIMLTDANDVIALRRRDDEEIQRRWYKAVGCNNGFLAASYRLCCPKSCTRLDTYWDTHTKITNKNQVCAGQLMGYNKDIQRFYKWALASGVEDDQRALGMYMNLFPTRVYLDQRNTLFIAFNATRPNIGIDIQDNHIVVDEAVKSDPFFIHTPGEEQVWSTIHSFLPFVESASILTKFTKIILQKDAIITQMSRSQKDTMIGIWSVIVLLIVCLITTIICIKKKKYRHKHSSHN